MNEAGAKVGASELRLRVVSALVLAAVILGVTLFGGWPFRLIWTAVAGLVAYEWLAMVSRKNAVAGGIGVGLAGLALGLLPLSGAALAGVAALAGLIGAVVTLRTANQRLLEACGIAYALCFALVTPVLRETPGIGLALIIWTFAVVWLTDIAAYFTGRKLGGPKLMPAVSPKKTWSGAIGGAVAGMVGGYLVWRLMPSLQGVTAAGPVIAASLAGSIVSQAGDLFESSLKRRFDAKDSSKLIPGHGGFLDRLDGYWAVLVLAGFALFALHLNI